MTRLIKYAESRARLLNKYLEMAKRYYAVEGIHMFRVEVKRRRALQKMLSQAGSSTRLPSSVRIPKKLYRTAGTLRDIDICQAKALQLLDYEGSQKFINYLKHQELRKRNRFSEIAGRYSSKSFSGVRAFITESLKGMTEREIRALAMNRILNLAGAIEKYCRKSRWSAEEIHDLRKLAKSLKYTLDIWQIMFGETRQISQTIESLKKVYGIIGEWCDLELARAKFDKFKSKHGFVKSTTANTDLDALLKSHRRQVYSRIKDEIPKLKATINTLIHTTFNNKPQKLEHLANA